MLRAHCHDKTHLWAVPSPSLLSLPLFAVNVSGLNVPHTLFLLSYFYVLHSLFCSSHTTFSSLSHVLSFVSRSSFLFRRSSHFSHLSLEGMILSPISYIYRYAYPLIYFTSLPGHILRRPFPNSLAGIDIFLWLVLSQGSSRVPSASWYSFSRVCLSWHWSVSLVKPEKVSSQSFCACNTDDLLHTCLFVSPLAARLLQLLLVFVASLVDGHYPNPMHHVVLLHCGSVHLV